MRQTIVNTAVSYLGCKESDGSHRKIIDIYNSHKPLARGYAVTYTDAWCAAFVSAMAIKCGLTHIIPTECGCGKMIDLFKKMDSWEENDAYKPEPGDIIFYDWQDSGYGDNTGGSDHVGIVEKVTGSTITVIEGNYSNSVKRRTLQVNGKTIRGYGVPKYKTGLGSNTGNTGNTDKAQTFKVGDTVQFTGNKHYVSSAATKGSTCKPGKATVTVVSKGAKHPYHLVRVNGGGSTVYGWVDADAVKPCGEAQAFKVGDTVQFTGNKHYVSSAATKGSACKPGKAKVTAVSKGAKHPYHLVRVDGAGSTVYGWVDADAVKK